jgi:hypothetical protein
MTPDAIHTAYERAYPGEQFHSLTFDVLAAGMNKDRHRQQFDELPATMDDLVQAVALLARKRGPPLDGPVSLAEAARLLRVSKSRSLLPAIKRGDVCVVRVGGRLRIAMDELERLEVEGLHRPPVATGKRRRRTTANVSLGTVEEQVADVLSLEQ